MQFWNFWYSWDDFRVSEEPKVLITWGFWNCCKNVTWETSQHWQRKEVLFPIHVTPGLIFFCQFKSFCSFNCLLLLTSCSCIMCMMAQVLNSINISLQMWLFSWGSNVTPVVLWGKKFEDKKEISHMTYIGFLPWEGVYLTFLPLKLFLHCC